MYKKQLVFFISTLVLFSAFFFGCIQDKFDAGIDLVPDSLRIKTNATDSFTVAAYTYLADSVLTGNLSKVLVGEYTDPILGIMKASFVTQMIPASTNTDSFIATGAKPDSLVIYLRYPLSGIKVYGNSTDSCQIDIMRINNYLHFSDVYYYNYNIDNLVPGLEFSTWFKPNQIIDDAEKEADAKWQILKDEAYAKDSTVDLSTIQRPSPIAILPIKFPDNLRDDFFDLISKIDTTTFAQYVNGFYFTPSSSSPSKSISVFDYTDAETKAILYYQTLTTDSIEYPIALNSSTTRFNLFKNTYNEPSFLPDLDNPKNKQDSVVYVHGIAGLRTKIYFPNIDELNKQGRYAVNKAELFLTAESSVDTLLFTVPSNLILRELDNNGNLDGYLTEYINPQNRTYTGVSFDGKQYLFDITLYIQRVLDGKISNSGLVAMLPDESTNPSRVVLTSPTHTTNKMKLVLTLTKLSD